MLNSKKLKEDIIDLFAESQDVKYVTGNGIITGMSLGFDIQKLIKRKKDIARVLQLLGVDEKPLVSLGSLTTEKDGTVWNKLETLEDFQALDLLVAVSNASGFLANDEIVQQLNINTIGEINSILISRSGRELINDDDKWLKLIRTVVVDKMFFVPDKESLKLTLSTPDPVENEPKKKPKGLGLN